MNAHQLQQPATEHEAVASPHARDKTFLDRADLAATQILHGHARIADDGADVHAVAACEPRIWHAPDTGLVRHGAVVVGVSRQRFTALAHKVERPLPVGW